MFHLKKIKYVIYAINKKIIVYNVLCVMNLLDISAMNVQKILILIYTDIVENVDFSFMQWIINENLFIYTWKVFVLVLQKNKKNVNIVQS